MKNITQLSHSELLHATRTLVIEERRITAFVLGHLEEIERRRLHLENHSSLFDFCRRELGYSEDQANARISAMRLSREVPEVIAKVESGAISLTNLVKAQSYFRQEVKAGNPVSQAQKKELLLELEGKSVRECERMIADLMPESALLSERERAISSTHTEITFSADAHLKKNLDQIRAIWGHQGQLRYAELFQKMSEMVLSKIDPASKAARASRSKAVKSPGAPQVISKSQQSGEQHGGFESHINVSPHMNVEPQPIVDVPLTPPPEFVTPKTRTIPAASRQPPAASRQKVWQRDEGRCTHRFPATGMRCGSRFALELDHVIPFAFGGTHELENLRLLCRAHHGFRTENARAS